MHRPDRERLLDEITVLNRKLETLERELATVVSDDALPTQVKQAPAAAAEKTLAEGRPQMYSRPPEARAAEPSGEFLERYSSGEPLGVGGMGEVRLCMDRRIGRAVAMKLILPHNAQQPKLRARFLFEAKVQGQLEHPSIVPVYDIGVRPDGVEYFTMKRVHGRTLHEILKSLALGDKRTALAFSRRRLLSALQSACLAMEFAHQRGVLHRDLKPANLMLGSLGELSILDWGLAKIVRGERAITPSPEAAAALEAARASEETAVGEILGTPGYMAPEQAGGASDVDARSDVFALGAMLYEILTLKHLVPGKTAKEIGTNTLMGRYDARISERLPELDVPPELEEACVRATALDRSQRMASAMELHDAIERYLEGDRDVKRRRGLAARHTRAAISAVAELAEASDPEKAKAARARAVSEVTRALAIDPENPTALRTMMKLMTDGAGPATPEAEAAVAAIESNSRLKVARRGTLAYLICASYLLVVAWLGVRSWQTLAAAGGLFLLSAGVAFFASRKRSIIDRHVTAAVIIVLSSCAIALASCLFGPFVYLPSLCAANVVVFVSGVDARMRNLAIACGALVILGPVLAEQVGLVPPSWVFENGRIVLLPRAVEFPPAQTTLLLAVEALGTVLFPALLVGAERDARTKAERKLAIQAQQFAEFLPKEAKTSQV
jgi:eukaryotic-like serine/threonine-protein kinase